ncbi:MAG: alpha/beta hydrolase [Myxococcales bacterium]|nr:alpha/beta hydrolase [Myxococcales bacterium]
MTARKTFHSFDGTRLSYSLEGEGPRDFALCDGIGCAGYVWRHLAPALKTQGRVIHLHMRGHGESDPPANPKNVGITDLADDWGRLLAETNAQDVVLIGHSMGVQVALETWHRHRERIAGLVLMCGSFQNPVATFRNGKGLAVALPVLQRLTRFGGRPLRRVWKEALNLPIAYHVARMAEIHPDLLSRRDFDPYLADLGAIDPALFTRMLAGAASHSASGWLEQVDVPVLVIGASEDHFTPVRLSEEMAARIPDARLVLIEEGTHSAPIEHPMRVQLEIERFIAALPTYAAAS